MLQGECDAARWGVSTGGDGQAGNEGGDGGEGGKIGRD